MTSQGMLWGFIVFGGVIAAFWCSNNKKVQAAQLAKALQIIGTGATGINLVLATSPLVLSEHENVVAVLPKTTLLEPKAVRVRQGRRHSSSMRAYGYSAGSGDYTSTTESLEQLRAIDVGTLVVTDQRIAFMGQLKTVSIDLIKIIGVDNGRNEIGIHCKDKEKVESFRIAKDLMLTYQEDCEAVSVPFDGQILGCIVSRTMTQHEARKSRAAQLEGV
jgi:hypothetical protein